MTVVWSVAIRSPAALHRGPPACAGHSLISVASIRSQSYPQIVDCLYVPCLVTIRWRLKQAVDGSA